MSQLILILVTTLFYGLIYTAIHQADPEAFGFESVIDPFYFAFTTMSTVGYGDYGPKTNMAKMVVMSQQFILMGEILSAIDFGKRGIRFKPNKLP
tara:strand:- start:108 stop:392 length:285 start_codon:yes stop_codon:yes gene_type:complete